MKSANTKPVIPKAGVDPSNIVVNLAAIKARRSSENESGNNAGGDEAAVSLAKNLFVPGNAEFVAAIFNDLPLHAQAVVTAKVGDPQEGGWFPHGATEVQRICTPEQNNYFNCASFRSDENGKIAARKDQASAYHALVLDDVGTKVDRNLLANVSPTWELETSPGNFQIGFKLSPPLTDPSEVERLQQRIAAAGLTDKGAMGMARWVRLPNGINGKPKHTIAGKRFACRLHRWNPGVSYTASELIRILAPTPIDETPPPVLTNTFAINRAQPELSTLSKLLEQIDPDCGYADWLSALMVIFHETAGSDAGLDLADLWSSKGQTYRGRAEVELKWRSFSASVPRPVTLGTLIAKAKASGANVAEIMGDEFKPCKTVASVNVV